jgi:hypothetical protein
VRRIREVSALASSSNLRVLVVPSMSELAGGRVRASDIRPISVECFTHRMRHLFSFTKDQIVSLNLSHCKLAINSAFVREVAARVAPSAVTAG